jgi:hypothetical protein
MLRSPSSSSELVKVESDDKLLILALESDLDRPGCGLGLSTVSRFLACPPSRPTRRATCKHRIIPLFLAFQSALTQDGQCRVSVDDPAGIIPAQDDVVHGLGVVVVVTAGMAEFSAAVSAMGTFEGRERCGIGRGRGLRHLMVRGGTVWGPETGGTLHLGPGLGRFLPMIGGAGGLITALGVGLVVGVVGRDDEVGTGAGGVGVKEEEEDAALGPRHWSSCRISSGSEIDGRGGGDG